MTSWVSASTGKTPRKARISLSISTWPRKTTCEAFISGSGGRSYAKGFSGTVQRHLRLGRNCLEVFDNHFGGRCLPGLGLLLRSQELFSRRKGNIESVFGRHSSIFARVALIVKRPVKSKCVARGAPLVILWFQHATEFRHRTSSRLSFPSK